MPPLPSGILGLTIHTLCSNSFQDPLPSLPQHDIAVTFEPRMKLKFGFPSLLVTIQTRLIALLFEFYINPQKIEHYTCLFGWIHIKILTVWIVSLKPFEWEHLKF